MLSLPGLGRLSFAVPSPSAAVTGRMLADADAHLPDHPEIVTAYHAARRLPGYGAAAAAIFRGSLRVGGRARRTMVLTDEEQARISQPVLFVWGDREPYGRPEIAHRAAGLMPNARVEVVGDAWHHPWLADPDAVAQLLSTFLRRARCLLAGAAGRLLADLHPGVADHGRERAQGECMTRSPHPARRASWGATGRIRGRPRLLRPSAGTAHPLHTRPVIRYPVTDGRGGGSTIPPLGAVGGWRAGEWLSRIPRRPARERTHRQAGGRL